jgi:hypothetical protein
MRVNLGERRSVVSIVQKMEPYFVIIVEKV